MPECEVCGRDKAGLEEIGHDPEFEEHQGVLKCGKCIHEYSTETHEGEREMTSTDESESVQKGSKDWKERINA